MRTVVVALLLALLPAAAQDAAKAKWVVRGDRFHGLTYDELTPEQKILADRALAGRGPIGTFNILLRSPQLSEAMRGLTGQRSLSAKQMELAIILSGRYWTTQFEFLVHHRAALRAGLSERTANAVIEGRRPTSLAPDEEPVYNFVSELLNYRTVSDSTVQSAKNLIGEKGIVDMLGVLGFYGATSFFMNVDRYPMDAGQTPELKPLEHPIPLGPDPVLGPPSPKFAAQLRGDRFHPLTVDEMTPEQKAVFEKITSGQIQGGTNGPLNTLLRSPQVAESGMRYGEYIRFHSPLPTKLNELAALITIRDWTAQFPWIAHHRAGAPAGLNEATIGAIAEGRRPASLQPDEAAVYNFATELLKTKQVSDATFNSLKTSLGGERGVVELIGVMGYYQIVSMAVNIDRYPLPEGGKPELKPLANPIP